MTMTPDELVEWVAKEFDPPSHIEFHEAHPSYQEQQRRIARAIIAKVREETGPAPKPTDGDWWWLGDGEEGDRDPYQLIADWTDDTGEVPTEPVRLQRTRNLPDVWCAVRGTCDDPKPQFFNTEAEALAALTPSETKEGSDD